jgi:hypothetical protein
MPRDIGMLELYSGTVFAQTREITSALLVVRLKAGISKWETAHPFNLDLYCIQSLGLLVDWA